MITCSNEPQASSVVGELLQVARRFKVPRLADICRRIQLAISSQSLDGITSPEDARGLEVWSLLSRIVLFCRVVTHSACLET